MLFLDEVHRFNRAQQDALLPSVEAGELTLIGATTENPFFSVNGPLLSRSTLFRLEPLSADDILVLVAPGPRRERSQPPTRTRSVFLAGLVDGDARAALNSLEVALALAEAAGREVVTVADVEAARSTRALRYGDDEHYDVISAFIKSIRGSDADAGLYWLARMLEAGEDARFIARRLVILASEDVGMADPQSLLVADAAARAVEFVGLPEAQLNLAQAVVHLANAPKSNSVTTAAREGQSRTLRPLAAGAVPKHLRDASYHGRSPPRARQRVRVPPRRARWLGGAAVPAGAPGRADATGSRPGGVKTFGAVQASHPARADDRIARAGDTRRSRIWGDSCWPRLALNPRCAPPDGTLRDPVPPALWWGGWRPKLRSRCDPRWWPQVRTLSPWASP